MTTTEAIDRLIDFSALQAHFSDHKNCKVCGETFQASNPSKITCSNKCRQRLYRARLKVRACLESHEQEESMTH